MKCMLDKDGLLHIEAETELESYALKGWYEKYVLQEYLRYAKIKVKDLPTPITVNPTEGVIQIHFFKNHSKH